MAKSMKDMFDNDREIQKDIKNTEYRKQRFIEEIRNGLGEKIKSNPNEVNVIEKPKLSTIQKFVLSIKTFFKTF